MTPPTPLQDFAAAVEAYVLDWWENDAGYDPTALSFSGLATDPQGLSLWGRVTIRFGSGSLMTQGEVGAAANEISGVVLIQLFTPSGTGEGAITTAADYMRAALNRIVIGNGQFMVPAPTGQPETDSEDSAWQTMTVSAPFVLIETV